MRRFNSCQKQFVCFLWTEKWHDKESHGSHGNFYEGEQEQCCSVPLGALYVGLRNQSINILFYVCSYRGDIRQKQKAKTYNYYLY